MSAANSIVPDIRAAREALGLSMGALARLAGTATTTILRIEGGRQVPSQATLLRLIQALEADPEEHALASAGIERGSKEHLRDIVPYQEDDTVRYAVACHPEGLELEQIADVLGIWKARVDEAQARALEKLRAQAQEDSPLGEMTREWIETVVQVRASRLGHETPGDWMTIGGPLDG